MFLNKVLDQVFSVVSSGDTKKYQFIFVVHNVSTAELSYHQVFGKVHGFNILQGISHIWVNIFLLECHSVGIQSTVFITDQLNSLLMILSKSNVLICK